MEPAKILIHAKNAGRLLRFIINPSFCFPSQDMPDPTLCSEDEIVWLVHAFYARVRKDDVLGPIFDSKVSDWNHHLEKLVDFWSGALRGTGRYRGTPMPKHAALPGLAAATFERWLSLFHDTTALLENAPMRERANELAGRIAQSLWYGYQLSRNPATVIPSPIGA